MYNDARLGKLNSYNNEKKYTILIRSLVLLVAVGESSELSTKKLFAAVTNHSDIRRGSHVPESKASNEGDHDTKGSHNGPSTFVTGPSFA
jgi:hypothetical protein